MLLVLWALPGFQDLEDTLGSQDQRDLKENLHLQGPVLKAKRESLALMEQGDLLDQLEILVILGQRETWDCQDSMSVFQ